MACKRIAICLIIVCALAGGRPAAAIDNFVNFSRVTVSTGYTSAATTIVLLAGQGATLASPPFNCTWYNATDSPDPATDANVEIIRVTSLATDTLTIARGAETGVGSTARNHNTAGKTYKLDCTLTAKTLGEIKVALGSSAGLRASLSDPSGTGAALFAGGNIGAATGTSLALSALAGSGVRCAQVDNVGNFSVAAAGCAGGGDFSSNTALSVDSELMLFSGIAGKTGKRSAGTGLVKATAGVASYIGTGASVEAWLAVPTVPNLGTALGSQSANCILASPDGASGPVTCRPLAGGDLSAPTAEASITTGSTISVYGGAYEVNLSTPGTINLPTTTAHAGAGLAFRAVSASATATLDGNGAQQICDALGCATTKLLLANQTANLIVDRLGTYWQVISGEKTPCVGGGVIGQVCTSNGQNFSTFQNLGGTVIETAISGGVTIAVYGGSYEVSCSCTIVLPTVAAHPGATIAFTVLDGSGSVVLDGAGAENICDPTSCATTKTYTQRHSVTLLVNLAGTAWKVVSGQ